MAQNFLLDGGDGLVSIVDFSECITVAMDFNEALIGGS